MLTLTLEEIGMRVRRVVSAVVLCASVALSAAPASAEWFGDLFIGGAFNEKSDPVLETTFGGVPTTITTKDLRHDDSIVFGGRFGYWLEPFPYLGFGLDVSHFGADAPPQATTVTFNPDPLRLSGPSVQAGKVEIGVTVISFDLMLRWPLMTSQAFPKGQLQPYMAVGPALFIVKAEDFGNLVPITQSDTHTSVGVKVAAGAAWLFTPNIGVFGEYRFLHYNPESNLTGVDPITGAPASARINDSQSTHQIVAGVTFRF
jgi:opacity protein-like surface antigen